MPLHRARAEEKPRSDLRVGEPVARELGDLALLGGQVVPRLDRPPAHPLAGRHQLYSGALGERLRPDRRERLVRRAELLTGIDTTILSAQPLAVEQLGARRLDAQ